nr:hypothetical protein BdHM001_06140 [Bdellovibrio sp. HM001]
MPIWRILFLLFCLNQTAQAASSLKTVIGENMSAPWYIANSQGTPKGITAEYLLALSKEINQKIEILVLPKFRIKEYSQKNKIDLNCYTSREWAHISDEDVFWSEPLFVSKNLIVSKTTPPKSLDQLTGERIGTVLKYNYPTLQDRFDSGKLIRDDSSNEETNLQKLESSRFNYALAEAVHLAYYLSHHKNSKIQSRGLVVEEVPVRCWLRKGAPLSIGELNAAIRKLKTDGSLERIFAKYR